MKRAGVGCDTQPEQSDPRVSVHNRMSAHLTVVIEYNLTSCPHPLIAIGDGWYLSGQSMERIT